MQAEPKIEAPVVTTSVPNKPAKSHTLPLWVRQIIFNPKALIGLLILMTFVMTAILAPTLATHDPSKFVARPHQAPSSEHLLGTTGQGQDVWSQIVYGTRVSLGVGLATGILTTLVGIAIGLTAAYAGGIVDDILSLMMNVMLIIPSLPLLVTLAAFLKPGPITILLVLTVTGWAWPARVLRSQALSLREKDFVAAAVVSGESSMRIMFREILPNMISLVGASFIGSTTYAIGAEAALEFLGLGDVSTVSWGTILFWAQNNAGMLTGAWWTFVPAGLCIALIAFALSMLNYSVDEITNPRLRAEKEITNVLKNHSFKNQRATPVVRSK